MGKIQGIEVVFQGGAAIGEEANTVARRLGGKALPRWVGGAGRDVPFTALVTGGSPRETAERVKAMWDLAPLVEVEGAGVSGPAGRPVLVAPMGLMVAYPQGGTHAVLRGRYVDLGEPGTYRGRLWVQVRTLANNWSHAGLTRILVPSGSANVSETVTGETVDTPVNNGFTANWGSQDAAYVANEVARGRILYDIRSGFYGNMVGIESPEGTAATYARAASSVDPCVLTHGRGSVLLDPVAGTIEWRDNGRATDRSASVAGFNRWAVTSWTPYRAEVTLPDSVVVEVHAHGLVRIRNPGSKLTMSQAMNDQAAGAAPPREIMEGNPAVGTDWWMSSTEDWSVTADAVSVQNDGDFYVFYDDSADNGDKLSRTLMKDTWALLGLEVV